MRYGRITALAVVAALIGFSCSGASGLLLVQHAVGSGAWTWLVLFVVKYLLEEVQW